MKARILGIGFLIGLLVFGPTLSAAREASAGASPNPQKAHSAKLAGAALESLIPQDVAAVLFIRDLGALRDGLRQSALARAVLGTGLPLARYLRRIVEGLDLSGAMSLGAKARYGLVVLEAADPPRAVVLAEAASPEGARRAAERVRAALERHGPVRALARRGTPIWQSSPAFHGESFGLAQLDRILIFGPITAVERLIEDRAKTPNLAERPDFRLLQERSAKGAVFAFLNLERITPYVIGRVTARPIGGSISLLVPLLQFLGLSAFKAAGLTLAFEADAAFEEQHVIVDRKQSAMVAALIEAPSIEFATAQAIPEDVALAIFFGLDFPRLYTAALTTLGPLISAQLRGQSPESAIALLELQLGFRIKDELLASLGQEAALSWQIAADRVERDLFLAVRNPDQLRAILEKIIARQGARPIVHKEHVIYPLTDELAITVTRSEAILARTKRVKWILDQRDQGRVFGRTPGFAHWMNRRPPQAAFGLYATSAAFRLPWLRPLIAGGRSAGGAEAIGTFPPLLSSGFGVGDPLGLRGAFTSALSVLVLLDALLSVRSAALERTLLGTLALFTQMLTEEAR
ncbi:hypothetical protein HRbin08_01330 [bacterium HR08]|nr:hypothetical protein HRbin08_01330 [bacterium HR08]